MEGIDEFDMIDVELDEYFKRTPISRCRDAFLNILCDEIEEDDHLNEDDHPNQDAGEALEEDSDAGEEAQVQNTQSEDETDSDFEYAVHNSNVKWNRVRPVLYERYETPQQLKLCLLMKMW